MGASPEGVVRVVVRRAEPEDCEGIWRVFNDDEAYPGTLQLPLPSREMWRKRAAETPDTDYMFVACVGDEIVGHGGLHPAAKSPRRSHAMMLGIVVAGAWQGKGVGTALLGKMLEFADDWLNVFRIELTVYTDNERAIALYRKMGFEHEGTYKAYALRAGRYVDSHAMARLKPKQKI